MIDDDFESVFRKMMEQFRDAFGSLPEGSGTYRTFSGSFTNEPLDQNVEQRNDDPQVEKIDLGDSVLFLIQGYFDSEPEVKVEGEKITVTLGQGNPNIAIKPGFPVDLEKSNASYRNGVIEINAVKAESHQESDGYLKIE